MPGSAPNIIFFQAEDGIRDYKVTEVQTCALPISSVHITFIIVANVEHVIVAFEHAGQAAKSDIGGAAIAALRDRAHLLAPLHPHGRGHSAGDRSGVTEQRVQPRYLP